MFFGRFQHQKDVPLTEETLLEYITDPNVHDIIDMEHITDNQQFDAMVRQILSRTRVIQVEEVDHTTSERHVIFVYEIIWCWGQARELVYSEQIVHPDRHIEVIVDRPLRGAPVIDKAMYNQCGLNPLAYEDLTDRHGCVIAQLVTTEIVKRETGAKGSQKGGRDTRRLVKVNPTPDEIINEFMRWRQAKTPAKTPLRVRGLEDTGPEHYNAQHLLSDEGLGYNRSLEEPGYFPVRSEE
jgi:hypothetical protein